MTLNSRMVLMTHHTAELSHDLLNVLAEETPKLASLSESEAASRADAGPGWSRKHELGHLIDSATNNRVRFAMAALSSAYKGPTYDGDGWVKLGGYENMTWSALLNLWSAQNQALAALIANIPEDRLTVHCEIGSAPLVTLGFLIEDYILHMQHHLDHLQGREVSTSYPGAAMGV